VPPRDLLKRTRLFALSVLTFCRKAPQIPEAQEAIVQLRKSANSVRSNYRVARKGRSRAEFESKLHMAFEEADDCVDWLEHLPDGRTQEDPALLQRILLVSPTLRVTRSRSRYSRSGIAYLRVM
jgi:four helix bundle protein